MAGWNNNQLRKYNIKFEKIPVLQHDDPKVNSLLCNNKPVLIKGSKLVSSVLNWDLDYLQKHMSSVCCNVMVSTNHKFKYYDQKKITPSITFKPQSRPSSMTFSEFAERMKTWKKGAPRLYLQQTLNNSIGHHVVRDFVMFNWDWVMSKQKICKWGALTSNLLLISQEGNITPCHYDEQQNMFAVVKGYKRFILFPPSQFECLYPHPVHHPYDRQSQVDFDNPNYTMFPKFKDACGYEAVVGPEDVLYIPIYWFHHVESLMSGGYTVSINFWFKAGPIEKIEYPLQDYQKMAIMRNVEKMLGEALHDPNDVGSMLRTIVVGRYTSEEL
ncbi:hypoxia-inducible factor 1-alpha inhibitor-like isoform X1 [Adelges cooleyi]|uniref:hypoxia-inducible factor 1-alpha inhibitor-like isoform X1 n=2 Tax=Adelges cooleyi TaxID=133065 RepID=UPI00217F3BC1|nr:hypoxia-inducible factor 1-alpha inhibitor-like isoform X1 [Adelges cooleyi]